VLPLRALKSSALLSPSLSLSLPPLSLFLSLSLSLSLCPDIEHIVRYYKTSFVDFFNGPFI